jgi:hypothetical protein
LVSFGLNLSAIEIVLRLLNEIDALHRRSIRTLRLELALPAEIDEGVERRCGRGLLICDS